MAKVISAVMISCRFIHVGKVCLKNMIIRKPVKVINPTYKNINLAEEPFGLKARLASDQLPAIIKKPEENVVPYEKLSKYDHRFTKTITLIKNRKQRERSGKILLEGKCLINDAIKAGMQMKTLYFTREEDLNDINIKDPKEIEVCKVLYRTMKVWSSLSTSPGIMAVFKRPSAEELNVLSQPTIPVTILCNNIRDPGNLGAIIRNAASAGCQNILLTKGCVDPWEIKVLRSGSGGHFRIPIVNNIEWSQISNYIPSDSTIFIADSSADIVAIDLSTDFINLDEEEEMKEGEEKEETRYFTHNEHDQCIHVDESFNSESELEKYQDIRLPCHLYCDLKYPSKNIVLYVGGEAHGVDPKIIKMACEYGGRKIKVPMENGMDSLNSAFAMTVILYEIKRQLPKVYITK